mmetsp:Transcript_63645/g.105829  ORF Transcript_63645/g.105829 Transcript_63645/m.105829 type:complete len:230 (-) Transcript_63645:253-942(-)
MLLTRHLLAVFQSIFKKLEPFSECELCCERVFFLAIKRNSHCIHRCCSTCWRRFLEAGERDTLRRMQLARSYALRCFGCEAQLDRALLRRYGPTALQCCAQNLDRREQLIRNKPASFSCVECPQTGCVGIGYDDHYQRQVMCFICQHQWAAPTRGILPQIWAWMCSWWPDRIDGVKGWRPCPHCGAAIMKDGGCPMMRCGMCGGAFRWGLTHNSVKGVIHAHLPPNTRR